MAENTRIKNPGNRTQVPVSSDYRMYEVDSVYPPVEGYGPVTIYKEFLTLNGDGVTTDMRVDGSVTSQDFYIGAPISSDIYVTSLLFSISAENATMTLNEFANLTALTNGCQLIFEDSINGDIIIADSIQTNFDLLQMARFSPSYGLTSGSVFKVPSAIPGATLPDTIFGVLRFNDYGYEKEYRPGIRLRAGSPDRLTFRINDDITGLTTTDILQFDMIAYGNRVSI